VEQERHWIRQVQKRQNAQAANQLVSRYYNEIYVYSYRQLGGKEAAMDLTQEIFIAALQSIERYDCRKGSFRAWLYRIATNKIIDSRRKTSVLSIPLEETELADEREMLVQTVEQRGLLEKIERYVSGLDHDTQQIYRLHLYGAYSFPEIAHMLGREEAAVKSRYYRLLNALRKEFEDEYSHAGA
jgi:RNA polymerase sigma factor (sigma-70 family)